MKAAPKRTSQTCSGCGVVDGDIRIGKNYECGICRLRMDADIDAANSILARGMSAVGVGTPSGRNMARITVTRKVVNSLNHLFRHPSRGWRARVSSLLKDPHASSSLHGQQPG